MPANAGPQGEQADTRGINLGGVVGALRGEQRTAESQRGLGEVTEQQGGKITEFSQEVK